MNELFPIAAGLVVTLLVDRLPRPGLKVALLLTLSVVLGFLATVISGEALLSWNFVVVDIAEVGFAAIAATATLLGWRKLQSARR
ncbi:MAG: hypothetical protein NVSMB42_27000 [Herpetosiphon sp.]